MRRALGFLIINALLLCGWSKPQYSSNVQHSQTNNLSPWAQSHMDEVQEMAAKLRNEYQNVARGQQSSYNSYGRQSELDVLAKEMSEQMVSEMNVGRLPYSEINKPNYFESRAASTLERLDNSQQLQQTQNLFDSSNHFDEISHYAFPPQVKIIDGKTYVTQKNCTTSTISNASPSSPFYSYFSKNLTQNVSPLYIKPSRHQSQSSSFYDRRSEGFVPNYNPEITVDGGLLERLERRHQAPIVIPVPKDETEFIDQHTIHRTGNMPDFTVATHNGDQNSLHRNIHVYSPPSSSHKVTVKKYNRTVITGSDGMPMVSGSESQSVWDNGQLVYNYYTPFGNTSHSIDEEWKHQERERLYWLFKQNTVSKEELERWQHQQEQRLYDLAYRHNTTLEEIKEWQRRELDLYQTLTNQYSTVANLTEWQQQERGRLNWLIHQNSVTKEELEKWQYDNQGRLYDMAQKYHISYEELKEWQRKELDRLYVIFNQQNSELENLKTWQMNERDRLNVIMQQHNVSVEQLQNNIQKEQERVEELSQQYHVKVDSMMKWYESELARLTNVINTQQEQMRQLTEWQRSERDRLESIIRQHNVTVEELNTQMANDRNYLFDLSRKYHISIGELEEWQRKEISRLREVGSQSLEIELKNWQKLERERLMDVIRQNDLTIEDFETKITNDRSRLQMLANQYQIHVEEIEEWLKQEGHRLQAEGLIKQVEQKLTDWQQNERDRLLAIVKQNELTIEELENRINKDNSRLTHLANHYHVKVEEIEEWLKKEIHRLQGEGLVKVDDLKEWQKSERQKLVGIIQQNELTIEEFEQKMKTDKGRLQEMAWQYHIDIEEIEDWLKKEGTRLQSMGLIKESHSNFTEWQTEEHNRLLGLIRQNELTINDLQERLRHDRQHIDNLAYVYQVRTEEIDSWLQQELHRLQSQGLLKVEQLKDWQHIERQRLQQIVNQNSLNIEEFEQQMKADRNRLQQLAYQYHVSIQEIEDWVRKEGNRFITLGLVKPVTVTHEELTEWQTRERNQLQSLAQTSHLTIEEFEENLIQERPRLQNMAWTYHTTVEEIEEFLRKEADRLVKMNLIHQAQQLKDWQKAQKIYIEQLLHMHSWSVEELDRKLKNDIKQLSAISKQYHITIEELERWYKSELDRLLRANKIYSENLVNWQDQEKARLYAIIQQQQFTIQQLEYTLWQDQENLRRLAEYYQITIEDLKSYQQNEIGRLYNLGLVGDLTKGEQQNWQKEETARLRRIATQWRITFEELEEYLKTDRRFYEDQLLKRYGITLQTLETWQRMQLSKMNQENMFDQTVLNKHTDWQKRERDRIYILIQSGYDGMKTLKEWQAQPNKLYEIAALYGITEDTLRNWQINELNRLLKVRNFYRMKLVDLAAFRENELTRLDNIAHSFASTGVGHAGDDRKRKMYLHSQGLIDLEGEYGGKEIDRRTSASARRNQTISSDRGDQPPQVYSDDDDYEYDIDDGSSYTREPTTPRPSYRPTKVPPRESLVDGSRPVVQVPGGYSESGRTYRRKEITYTVPSGYVPQAAKYSSGGSSSASATSYGNAGSYSHAGAFGMAPTSNVKSFEDMEVASLTKRDAENEGVLQEKLNLQSQRVVPLAKQEEFSEFEGQQIVQEQEYLGKLEDFGGQQIVQQEVSLGNLKEEDAVHYGSGGSWKQNQQKLGKLEEFGGQEIVQQEVSLGNIKELEEGHGAHQTGYNYMSGSLRNGETNRGHNVEQQNVGKLEEFAGQQQVSLGNIRDSDAAHITQKEQHFGSINEDLSRTHYGSHRLSKDEQLSGQNLVQGQQNFGKLEEFGGQQQVSLGNIREGSHITQKEQHFGSITEDSSRSQYGSHRLDGQLSGNQNQQNFGKLEEFGGQQQVPLGNLRGHEGTHQKEQTYGSITEDSSRSNYGLHRLPKDEQISGQNLVQGQQNFGKLEEFGGQQEVSLGNIREGSHITQKEQHYGSITEDSSRTHYGSHRLDKDGQFGGNQNQQNFGKLEEFGGQQRVPLGNLRGQEGTHQKEQTYGSITEDSSRSNYGSQRVGGHNAVHNQQNFGKLDEYEGQQIVQEEQYLGKLEDFGGQQIVQEDQYSGKLRGGHNGYYEGQQIVQQEENLNLGHYSEKQQLPTSYSTSTYQPEEIKEVQAEPVKEGFWSKIKSKTKDIFG